MGAARTFAEHAQTTFEVLSSVQGLRERIYKVDNSAQAADRNGGAIPARAGAIGGYLVKKLKEGADRSIGKGLVRDSDSSVLTRPSLTNVPTP